MTDRRDPWIIRGIIAVLRFLAALRRPKPAPPEDCATDVRFLHRLGADEGGTDLGHALRSAWWGVVVSMMTDFDTGAPRLTLDGGGVP